MNAASTFARTSHSREERQKTRDAPLLRLDQTFMTFLLSLKRKFRRNWVWSYFMRKVLTNENVERMR